MTLPGVIAVEDLAMHLGISERRLRHDARATGNCHVVGKKMFLTEPDVDRLLEHWRPEAHVRPRSPGVSPSGDYQTLLAMRRLTAAKKAGRRAKLSNPTEPSS